MSPYPLTLSTHTGIRRIRSRVHDTDLRVDKVVGNGWTWECKHGCRGGWEPSRASAMESLRLHKLNEHGER